MKTEMLPHPAQRGRVALHPSSSRTTQGGIFNAQKLKFSSILRLIG